MFRIVNLLLTAMLSALLFSHTANAQEVKRSISKIAGDLYLFKNKFHNSVFLVTPAGVIATDPINAAAAKWLKAEIAKRFNQKIKYVIYSHDHADHSSGGEVWSDEAVVIAHKRAKRAIIGEKRPTAIPDITFTRAMTVELGGKQVHLRYLGRSHSDNMIVMHFPAERALFTVDFISVKRVGFKDLSDSYFPDWLRAMKMVGHMDFDILVPGHGAVGTKQDAIDHGNYLKDLYAAVLAAARAGQSLDEMKKSIDLSAYSSWGQFKQWGGMNIDGVYRQVMSHRRGN